MGGDKKTSSFDEVEKKCEKCRLARLPEYKNNMSTCLKKGDYYGILFRSTTEKNNEG